MMISPDMYMKSHENDSFEQLIEERDSLVEYVKELEEIVFAGDKSDPAWNILPGPDVQYQMQLEYLSKICMLMCEKFRDEMDRGN